MLGNQFKQIEDALINLSKLLSSIQGGNVPASVATTTATPARSYHQATPSSVVFVYMCDNKLVKQHKIKFFFFILKIESRSIESKRSK